MLFIVAMDPLQQVLNKATERGLLNPIWTLGQYSARSAYNTEFFGAFSELGWSIIWRFRAEHKCCFFINGELNLLIFSLN